MHYSMLGNTGLLVSRLCFGAMSFRAENGVRQGGHAVRPDTDARRLVAPRYPNWFDTRVSDRAMLAAMGKA